MSRDLKEASAHSVLEEGISKLREPPVQGPKFGLALFNKEGQDQNGFSRVRVSPGSGKSGGKGGDRRIDISQVI